MATSNLDKWREFFSTTNSDIFDIIKNAIMVAASDCPHDFKLNRDQIAELLFTCKSTKCSGCDKIELSLPNHDVAKSSAVNHDHDDHKNKNGVESKDPKESKTHSYDDVEALTDELEQESQMFDQVLRIKKILENYANESDDALFDSLRKLQIMPLSLETMKESEIGKTVNGLRKHGSKEITNLVKALIEEWRNMVDAFYSTAVPIAEAKVTPESSEEPVVEEEEEEGVGLPSPPLDEGAFFAVPNAMELAQFFDGMDDDGNLPNTVEFNKNRQSNGRRPNVVISENTQRKQDRVLKQTLPYKPNRPNGVETGQGRSKPISGESGPGRPKPSVLSKENKVQQKSVKGSVQKKPSSLEQSNCNNEATVRLKMEASKRKLHERYQEAEKAKKQRTIQVVEFQNLPKQSFVPKNTRPGNNNGQRGNNRM